MTDSIPLGRARPDSLFLLRRTPEDGCEHCVSAPRDAILELFPGSEELIRLDHRRTFSSELSHIRKKLNIMVLASLPVTRGGIIYRVAASTEALRRAFCLHFVPPKGDAILFTFRPRQISLPRVPVLIEQQKSSTMRPTFGFADARSVVVRSSYPTSRFGGGREKKNKKSLFVPCAAVSPGTDEIGLSEACGNPRTRYFSANFIFFSLSQQRTYPVSSHSGGRGRARRACARVDSSKT